MSDVIAQFDPDEDFEEQWQRTTDEPNFRDLSVSRSRWAEEWSLWVNAAEFIRDEPLEGEFRSGLDAALRAVPNVTDVREEDREVWIITGTATGPELIAAASVVVDSIAPRAIHELFGD